MEATATPERTVAGRLALWFLGALVVVLVAAVVTKLPIEVGGLIVVLYAGEATYLVRAAPRPFRPSGLARVPRIVWVNLALLQVLAVVASLYFPLNRPRDPLHVMQTAIDRALPLIEPFAVPYITFHAFMVFTVVVLMLRRLDVHLRTLAFAAILTFSVSDLIYVVFQTTDVRPAIEGSGLFPSLMRFIYRDGPYNDWPSLHVGITTLMAFAWARMRVPRWSAVAIVWSVLIISSTVFVKQHMVLDVLSGFTLSVTTYWLSRQLWEHDAPLTAP